MCRIKNRDKTVGLTAQVNATQLNSNHLNVRNWQELGD